MPTNRTRVKRRKRDRDVPEWVSNFIEHGTVPQDAEGWHRFTGWLYFGDSVPGLPDADTVEGRELWAEYFRSRAEA